jgi:hypothetical protein
VATQSRSRLLSLSMVGSLPASLASRRCASLAPKKLLIITDDAGAVTPRLMEALHEAGADVVPAARVDDGLFDVRVYEEMGQPALAEHFLAVKEGVVGDDTRIKSSSAEAGDTEQPSEAGRGRLHSCRQHPARFRVLSGGLLVIAGRGDALLRPAAQALVSAVMSDNTATRPHTAVIEVSGNDATSPGQGLQLAKRSGPLGIALAAGAAIALMPTLSRWIDRNRH